MEFLTEQLSNFSILSFYGKWQLVVCSFAFIALIGIWWHIARKLHDYGQIWLALSVLCWSFSGAIDIYEGQIGIEKVTKEIVMLDQGKVTSDPSSTSTASIQGWKSVFSLFNSLFILMALPWFKYIPASIQPMVHSKFWYAIIGLPFLFSLFPTLHKLIANHDLGLISELDVYYAVLTLAFLGYVLWSSFIHRRLPILAWLSVVCIAITFLAQVFKLTENFQSALLLSGIFKTSLIMLFFALALSWVKELTENIIPESNKIWLGFKVSKNAQGKYLYAATLEGIPSKNQGSIRLTPGHYELLYRFASKAKDKDPWLEIKPKNDERLQRSYDIQDYNEIKRLLVSLLDGLFEKGSWTQNKHYEPLKTALFEMSDKRERKIKLRLEPEQITLKKGV